MKDHTLCYRRINLSGFHQVPSNCLSFAVKIGGYEGTVLDLGLDVQYRPWRRFGVGAGLRYFRITVDDKRDSALARFEYEYFGPVIYGVFSF